MNLRTNHKVVSGLIAAITVCTSVSFAQTQGTKTTSTTNSNASKYFIIQNVATEKMRVYEKCTETPDCPHRLIMESEMVVGRTSNKGDQGQAFLTRVGYYKISKWVKFYEDGAKHYPSWYDPKYPEMPMKASSTDWMSDKYLPNPKQNVYRGAFGWYAAMVVPNADFQWIHGTYGWGRDGDKYIQLTRSFFVNLFSDPRSSGCTRLENQAVAWLRHHIEPGTEVFRVYANEAYADSKLSRYQSQMKPTQWDWTLTKTGVRVDNAASSDKKVVEQLMQKGLVKNTDILETGSYTVDQYPNGLGFTATAFGLGSSQGTTGDTYSIGKRGFKGVFLVDEGRFVNYVHPNNLPKGGTGAALPKFAQADVNFVLAEPFKRPGSDDTDRTPWGGISSNTYPQQDNVFAAAVGESFNDFTTNTNTTALSAFAQPGATVQISKPQGLFFKGQLNHNGLFEVPTDLKGVIDTQEYNELLDSVNYRKRQMMGFEN